MSEPKAFESNRIYWAVEQVELEAGDIDNLHLDYNLFYIKSEADKVITEKDKEIAKLQETNVIIANNAVRLNKMLDEKDKEITELKQKLEDVQASMYADVVDANMENRRLKRALWLARALRAKECKYKYETWERHEERKVYKDYDMIAIVSRKARMWRKVERKCLKKAEEYK